MSNTNLTGTVGTRERTRTVFLLLGMVLSLIGACALLTGTARADDGSLNMSFDTGMMNLGDTTGVKVIDPAATPPDPPATLNATLTGDGHVSTPASGFNFPDKTIEDLEASGLTVDAKIEISATAPVSGTFDVADGVSNISVPAQALITVSPANSTDALGICRITGFTLALGTTGVLQDPGVPDANPPHPAHNYDAAPFTPPANLGALVASWAGLPPSVAEGGSLPAAVCPAVDGLVGGPGGIWLSGIATPSEGPAQLPPSASPDITSGPGASTDSTEAQFEYSQGAGEDQTVNRFQCRLDSASSADWESCGTGSTSGSTGYADLTAGEHEFDVRAGNDIGYGPASSAQWTIVGAPVKAPKLLTTPPADGTDTGATFTFEKGAGETQTVDRFQCRLDSSGTWSACDSGSQSYSNLAVGNHGFELKAGNDLGYGPVTSYSWKVSSPIIPPDKTCAEDPYQAKCAGKLKGLKVTPKRKKAKRGKTVRFKVRLANSGDGFASGVKVCLTAPKKRIKTIGKRCRTVSSIAPGKAVKVNFKVKPTRKAKRGAKYKVKVKATGAGLNSLRAGAMVTVIR